MARPATLEASLRVDANLLLTAGVGVTITLVDIPALLVLAVPQVFVTRLTGWNKSTIYFHIFLRLTWITYVSTLSHGHQGISSVFCPL